jgi:class 3 adenylate cyclase/tetratricopeptide (TPR) repeat protein
LLSTYIAMDRRQALARGDSLPDRTDASALLADISGFTPLTEALVERLGPRRGAEELTDILNTVYTSLVCCVHDFGGSVVCFIGDALIGIFDGDPGSRAVACALQMQEAMNAFQAVSVPGGEAVSLAMKAVVDAGPVRRFLAGDPEARRIDVLAGATIDRLGDGGHLADRGEVVAGPALAARLGEDLLIDERGDRFGVVRGLRKTPEPQPWPGLATDAVGPESIRPLVLPEVYHRVISGHGDFLAELRPIAALFLRFEGLDYDGDDGVGEKLDAFTRRVQEVTTRYGGHVLLLTTADKGSHLYAAFGALEAHENDAERAVAAALALSRVPEEFDFVEGLQIGVSQGRVRVGGYGGETRRTYGALGETVNRAARLMGVAPLGEIRCGEKVHASTKARFTFDEFPEVTLKGMRRPQRIYRPTARKGERRDIEQGDLIGRIEEMETLRRCLRAACAGGRRVLRIEGEAGIGKSRLVGELHRMAVDAGADWLFGAASNMEQHTPYRAWREVALSLFGVESEADPAERRRRVVDAVVTLNPSYEERVPLLNDILGLDLAETNLTRSYEPQLRHEGLASLIGELLQRRSETGAAVLAFDDVQWMDSLSWDLLLSVARTLADRAALVVLAHRPMSEPVPRPLALLSALADAETLPLTSLPSEDTVALAAIRIGLPSDALPPQVASFLIERAEGNPFFALELVGALRDRKLLVIDGETCSLTADLETLRDSVPTTLEGVVLSRLDRLPSEVQSTVKVASVIGRSFLFRTLRDVYPGGVESSLLETQLAETGKRRLTVQEAEEPERSDAFQHLVTQQVAYNTLLFEQRRELHRDIAGWVETAHAESLSLHYPLLVFHWNRAGEEENECCYCRLAGSLAASQGANVEALAYFSRAVELAESLDRDLSSERRFEALELRAGILALLGRVDEERADLEALRAIARNAATVPRAEVDLLWADFRRRGGQYAEAVEEAERALVKMRASGEQAGAARALTCAGSALEGLGRFADARSRVEEALDLFRLLDALDGQAASLKTLGIVSARLGEFPQAMERFGEAHELFRKLGDRKGEADILGNLGAVYYYWGEYEKSIENTQGAQRVFHEMGNRIGSAKCLTNIGNAYSELGAFAEGVRSHEQALEIYQQLEDANGRADSLFNVGIALQALGVGGYPNLTFRTHTESPQLFEAIEHYEEALEIYAGIGGQRGKVLSNFKLGSARLCAGEINAAEQHLQIALDLSREMRLSSIEMQSLAALARAALLRGEAEQALAYSSKAIDLLGDQMPPEANELHFTHAAVLGAIGRADESTSHLELAYRSVVERAETVRDDGLRTGFLDACREIVTEWAASMSTSPE